MWFKGSLNESHGVTSVRQLAFGVQLRFVFLRHDLTTHLGKRLRAAFYVCRAACSSEAASHRILWDCGGWTSDPVGGSKGLPHFKVKRINLVHWESKIRWLDGWRTLCSSKRFNHKHIGYTKSHSHKAWRTRRRSKHKIHYSIRLRYQRNEGYLCWTGLFFRKIQNILDEEGTSSFPCLALL